MTGIRRKITPKRCLVPALLLIAVAVFSFGRPISSSFFPEKWRLFSVVSGSMEPALPIGTIIAVKHAAHHPLEPGSMITFRAEDILITHRIVDIGHDGEYYYITRGDANQNPDPQPVRPNQVVGKVYSVMPVYLTAALRFVRNPVAKLALIPTRLVCVLSMLRPLQLISKQREGNSMISWLCHHCNKRMYSAYDLREKIFITCLHCGCDIRNPHFCPPLPSPRSIHKERPSKTYYK